MIEGSDPERSVTTTLASSDADAIHPDLKIYILLKIWDKRYL